MKLGSAVPSNRLASCVTGQSPWAKVAYKVPVIVVAVLIEATPVNKVPNQSNGAEQFVDVEKIPTHLNDNA